MDAETISELEAPSALSSEKAAFLVLASAGSWGLALFSGWLGYVRIAVEQGRSCPTGNQESAWAANAVLLGCAAGLVLLPQTLSAGVAIVQALRGRSSRFAWAAMALGLLCAALGVGAQLVPATTAC